MAKKLLVLSAALIMCLGLFIGCGATQGIPHGAYHSCTEHGVVTKGGPEHAWQIRDGEAELHYLKYTIIEKDNKVYFEREASGSITARKFEVRFDKNTKILTVYMPSDFSSDVAIGEVKAHYYKK